MAASGFSLRGCDVGPEGFRITQMTEEEFRGCVGKSSFLLKVYFLAAFDIGLFISN